MDPVLLSSFSASYITATVLTIKKEVILAYLKILPSKWRDREKLQMPMTWWLVSMLGFDKRPSKQKTGVLIMTLK